MKTVDIISGIKRIMRVFLFLIFLILSSTSFATAESFFTSDAYIKGKFAFDAGKYKTAVKLWMGSAENGHPEAQGFIGGMYHAGLGVEKNYIKAMEWYLKAAKKGVAQAQLGIGNLYGDGLGVKKDYIKACMWFAISAEAGSERAEYNLKKVAARMSAADVVRAKKMAVEWIKAQTKR